MSRLPITRQTDNLDFHPVNLSESLRKYLAHRMHEGVSGDPPVHAEGRLLVHRVVEHLDRLQELARRHAPDHGRQAVDQGHSCQRLEELAPGCLLWWFVD